MEEQVDDDFDAEVGEQRISSLPLLGERPALVWDKPKEEREEDDQPVNWEAVREYDDQLRRRKQVKEIARAIFLQRASRLDLCSPSMPSLRYVLQHCERAADLVLAYGEEAP